MGFTDHKIRHLEMIQRVITRMNTNSFSIKGWVVVITAAAFALSAKNSNQGFILIPYFAIAIFWVLDGYFLSQERQYRGLYDEVRAQAADSDYGMDASHYNKGRDTWFRSIFSKTLLVFYGALLLGTVWIMCLMKGFI